jgi:hypothetical protein
MGSGVGETLARSGDGAGIEPGTTPPGGYPPGPGIPAARRARLDVEGVKSP